MIFLDSIPTGKASWARRFPRWFWLATNNLLSTENLNLEPKHFFEPEAETPQELIEVFQKRHPLITKVSPNAFIGYPDFLPFYNLDLGRKSGEAVCRIVGKFTQKTAEAWQEEIKNSTKDTLDKSKISEFFPLDTEEEKETIYKAYTTFLSDNVNTSLVNELVKLEHKPYGTGFLVARSYILTNYHLFLDTDLANPETALNNIDLDQEYIAEFGYEEDLLGRQIEPLRYALDKVVIYNEKLDYALVKLKDEPLNGKEGLSQAGNYFSWVTMSKETDVIAPPFEDSIFNSVVGADKGLIERLKLQAEEGEPVNIIQHPRGRRKEIVNSNNRIKGLYKDFLRYEADIDFSSSGSPVFNQQWQLVGLHCSAIPRYKEIRQLEDSFQLILDTNEKGEIIIEVEQGIRICRIVANIKQQIEDKLSQSEDIENTINLWIFFNEFVDDDKIIPDWKQLSQDTQVPETEIFDQILQKYEKEIQQSIDSSHNRAIQQFRTF